MPLVTRASFWQTASHIRSESLRVTRQMGFRGNRLDGSKRIGAMREPLGANGEDQDDLGEYVISLGELAMHPCCEARD